ncbi:hypothetical protein SARC_06092 [Sphaeroforma arctica JP610]|uniref:RanBP2-type domain-containing protein n=1 Tax=Sphaeroforma arctica JP610 TaxID=667725 RepID=A0A0L0FYH2_9EUKA|nr:hypothetical protein SARC_06092 [Sphaeroforma arctica JP610]KNC81591.1 hypothetical protein SARC_06092 [Sphaeroforma arctica JP610]|eukprot:XP_014155493.1 hypothetical protein SARC_06092 [Sphaeroforma arctica JP610]
MSNTNFRPGDWMCPACQNHNFARNQSCRKCNGPRVEGGGPPMHVRQPGPPMGGMGPPMHAGNPHQGGMPHGGGGIPANFRPGDWMCPACNNHNFARNNSCRSCYAPKQGGPPVGFNQGYPQQGAYNDNRGPANYHSHGGGGGSNWRAGDWQCNCGSHNFASRTNCRDCNIPQTEGAVEGGAPPAMQQGGNYGGGGNNNMPSNWKPGDWKCVACNYHNFARGITCRQCNAPKPEVIDETTIDEA